MEEAWVGFRCGGLEGGRKEGKGEMWSLVRKWV